MKKIDFYDKIGMEVAMRKVIGCFLILIILFMPQASALIDDPKTLGDLRANYNELLQKQKENEAMSEAAKKEIQEKEAAVKQAEEDIYNKCKVVILMLSM